MSSRRTGQNRVRQRYVCAECGDHQMIPVHPKDADRQIGYACGSCRRVTDHEPRGKTDWY